MKYISYIATALLSVLLSWIIFSTVYSKSMIEKESEKPEKVEVVEKSNFQAAQEGLNLENEKIELVDKIEELEQKNALIFEKNIQLARRLKEGAKEVQAKDIVPGRNTNLTRIPESHKKILERPEHMPKTLRELHGEFAQEEQDIGWALEKEQQIRYYLDSHRFNPNWQILSVDCRTSLCEIVGIELNNQVDAWGTATSEMREQPWWEFSGSSSSSSGLPDGTTPFIAILSRKIPIK